MDRLPFPPVIHISELSLFLIIWSARRSTSRLSWTPLTVRMRLGFPQGRHGRVPALGNIVSCRLHIMSIRHVGLARDDARERLSTLISASEMWLCWWSGGDDGIDGGAVLLYLFSFYYCTYCRIRFLTSDFYK